MPKFYDRLVYAFTGRFRTPPAVKMTVAALRPSWEGQQPEYAINAKFDVLVKDGYRKNELIFACLEYTAATGAQLELIAKNGRDGKRLDAHPLLDLMHHPNPIMSEAEFWAAVILYQKLAGRAVFEIERNNGNQIIALWPLRPDRLEIIPDAKRPIPALYKYTIPGMEPVPIQPKDVLDFPLFDPLDQFTSFPPVAVAGRVGDVDNSATNFIKMFFEKGGVPSGVLKTTQVLVDADVEDIRRRWRERYGGYENWMEPAILDRDAEYQRMALSFEEMGFEKLDARDEARLCMVLKVPPILVGAKIGLDRSTYSNYSEARKSWWEDTIIPMYESFLDVLSTQLLPQIDPSGAVVLDWDLSGVPALQENAEKLWMRVQAAFNAGAITLAQYHELLGMALPVGVIGQFYLRPSSVTMVPANEADTKPEPPPELAPGGEPGQDEEEAPDEETPPKAEELLAEIKLLRETAERLMDGRTDETPA